MDEKRRAPDLFDRRIVRLMLTIIVPAAVFVLVAAGIRVSTYGIDHTIVVWGQTELLAGQPAALRLVLISDDGRFFRPTTLAGALTQGDRRHPLFDGAPTGAGYARSRNFRVPEVPAGTYELELVVTFDRKKRVVRSPVRVVSQPPAEGLIIPTDTSADTGGRAVPHNGNRLSVFTEDRGAPTGLSSALFFLSQTDNGAPVAAAFKVALPGGTGGETNLVRQLQTDRLGLAAMPIKPVDLAYPITLLGNDKPRQLFPKVIYGGQTALMHNPIVGPGDRVLITVDQISRNTPVYADLFQRGRWVMAVSAVPSGSGTRLEFSPPGTGFYRIQLNSSALSPGQNVAVRHFYVLAEGESALSAVKTILKKLAEETTWDPAWIRAALAAYREGGSGLDHRLTTAFALSRLYAGHQKVPQLISSRKEDDRELHAYKSRFQRIVMLAVLLLGFGVSSLIAVIAIQSRRQTARMSAMIMGEADDADHRDEQRDRLSAWIQGAILFTIILGAFVAIALLIDTMTWMR
jgi:hypothetical protein